MTGIAGCCFDYLTINVTCAPDVWYKKCVRAKSKQKISNHLK